MGIQFLQAGGQVFSDDQILPGWMLNDGAFCNHGLQIHYRLRSVAGENLQTSLQNLPFPFAQETCQRLAMQFTLAQIEGCCDSRKRSNCHWLTSWYEGLFNAYSST